jgi:hypothetical protein
VRIIMKSMINNIINCFKSASNKYVHKGCPHPAPLGL